MTPHFTHPHLLSVLRSAQTPGTIPCRWIVCGSSWGNAQTSRGATRVSHPVVRRDQKTALVDLLARKVQQRGSPLSMESSTSACQVTKFFGTETSEKDAESGKRCQALLPGIPDVITLETVCTKLPWKTLEILALVSSAWRKAIATRQVFDARLRACSTETLLVHGHQPDNRLALYSSADKRCHELLPIPEHGQLGRIWSGCVVFDGKIYVLAPMRVPKHVGPRTDVYVLDVAGRSTEWEQCASMRVQRDGFACGTAAGKIYVFGGTCAGLPMRESDVYDPKLNSWTPIMPMKSSRFGHRVVTIGEELLVYGGDIGGVPSRSVEIYNPSENEWRIVGLPQWKKRAALFLANGEIHCMTEIGIDVYDIDKDSRKKRHTHCLPRFYQDIYRDIDPIDYSGIDQINDVASVVAADNNLFAVVSSYWDKNFKLTLIQSQLSDTCKEEIVWLATGCPGPSHVSYLQRFINL